MDRIKNLLKKSPLYFWFVLVLWQSIIELRDFRWLWSKIMDAFIWLVIAGLIGFGFFQAGQFSPFSFNWNWLFANRQEI